jgi:hypothetical protein
MHAVRLRLVPRDIGFYELFSKQAAYNHKAAELLRDLFLRYEERESFRERIRQTEHDCDEVTHTIMRRINTTFVTPFDREDIYRLASNLDNVCDHIDAAADFAVLHSVDDPLPELAKLSEVLLSTARVAEEALTKLKSFKGLEEYWVEINRLENEGDQIYRRTVAHLYSGDFKAMDVLKHKDVIEELEHAIDSLEDVANTIESIVLKHA